MFVLILLVVTATGQIALKTLPFKSETHCTKAADRLGKINSNEMKVTAVCIHRGLAH